MRKSRTKTYKKRGGQWFSKTPPAPGLLSHGTNLVRNQLLQNNPGAQNALDFATGKNLGWRANMARSGLRMAAKTGYYTVNNPATRSMGRFVGRQALNAALKGQPSGGNTRKNKRGGNVVRAFNTYNDSFTMHAKPVSGYNTAMPHNWVGGRRSRKRR